MRVSAQIQSDESKQVFITDLKTRTELLLLLSLMKAIEPVGEHSFFFVGFSSKNKITIKEKKKLDQVTLECLTLLALATTLLAWLLLLIACT
jgi:hypothetical protein